MFIDLIINKQLLSFDLQIHTDNVIEIFNMCEQRKIPNYLIDINYIEGILKDKNFLQYIPVYEKQKALIQQLNLIELESIKSEEINNSLEQKDLSEIKEEVKKGEIKEMNEPVENKSISIRESIEFTYQLNKEFNDDDLLILIKSLVLKCKQNEIKINSQTNERMKNIVTDLATSFF